MTIDRQHGACAYFRIHVGDEKEPLVSHWMSLSRLCFPLFLLSDILFHSFLLPSFHRYAFLVTADVLVVLDVADEKLVNQPCCGG